jgi:hypothetical protein
VATPDGPVTEDINDNGKPFELTAIADEEDNSTFAFPGYSYVYDGPNPNGEFVPGQSENGQSHLILMCSRHDRPGWCTGISVRV